MKIYILVHGAYHGGWVWDRVKSNLEKLGHQVFCPTLACNANTSLSDHIDEVCKLIFQNNLKSIILVGHSYAGMVITGIADQLPERIKKLIYVDALVPKPNQSVQDFFNENRAEPFQFPEVDSMIPSPPATHLGLEKPEDIAWTESQYRPQPIQTFQERLFFDTKKLEALDKTYIYCSKQEYDEASAKTMKDMLKQVHDGDRWDYFELPTKHSCMITMSEALVDLF